VGSRVLTLSLCRAAGVAELFLNEHSDQKYPATAAAAITTTVNILFLVTYKLGLIIETQHSKTLNVRGREHY
jgi:hypothetical protein